MATSHHSDRRNADVGASASRTDGLAKRYSRETALRHECLYGWGYQGPGSEAVFLALVQKADFRPGQRVLDLGCGLGGDAFRLAALGAGEVVGVDAAPDMVAVAEERRREAGEEAITFTVGDARDTPVLGHGDFDLVWTRDSLSYVPVENTGAVWARLITSLRPDGRLLLTDYGRGASPANQDFTDQMAAWGAHLRTFNEHRSIAVAAGFTDVVVEDWSHHLLASQLDGLRRINELEDELLSEMPEEALEGLRDRWREKRDNSQAGHLTWPVVTARRPS